MRDFLEPPVLTRLYFSLFKLKKAQVFSESFDLIYHTVSSCQTSDVYPTHSSFSADLHFTLTLRDAEQPLRLSVVPSSYNAPITLILVKQILR